MGESPWRFESSRPHRRLGAPRYELARGWFKERAAGHTTPMADQEDRERESRESAATKFEEAVEHEHELREEEAAELEREGPLKPEDG